VGVGLVARGILAALARVRAPAEAVHRDRQRLVGLARDRAQAHRPRAEAPHDRARRLDRLERDRRTRAVGRADLQEAAQRRLARRLLVDRPRVLAVLLEGLALAHGRVGPGVALQRRADVAV